MATLVDGPEMDALWATVLSWDGLGYIGERRVGWPWEAVRPKIEEGGKRKPKREPDDMECSVCTSGISHASGGACSGNHKLCAVCVRTWKYVRGSGNAITYVFFCPLCQGTVETWPNTKKACRRRDRESGPPSFPEIDQFIDRINDL